MISKIILNKCINLFCKDAINWSKLAVKISVCFFVHSLLLQPPLPEEDYPSDQLEDSHISLQLPKDFQLSQIKRAVIPRAVVDMHKDIPVGWTHSVGADGKTLYTNELSHEQVTRVHHNTPTHMHTHARTRTHTHTCAHTHTHTQTHTNTHTHTHARAHTRTRAHTHAHARTHTQTHTNTHTHTHARAHTRTRAHTHTNTHTHTHTHTQSWEYSWMYYNDHTLHDLEKILKRLLV